MQAPPLQLSIHHRAFLLCVSMLSKLSGQGNCIYLCVSSAHMVCAEAMADRKTQGDTFQEEPAKFPQAAVVEW